MALLLIFSKRFKGSKKSKIALNYKTLQKFFNRTTVDDSSWDNTKEPLFIKHDKNTGSLSIVDHNDPKQHKYLCQKLASTTESLIRYKHLETKSPSSSPHQSLPIVPATKPTAPHHWAPQEKPISEEDIDSVNKKIPIFIFGLGPNNSLELIRYNNPASKFFTILTKTNNKEPIDQKVSHYMNFFLRPHNQPHPKNPLFFLNNGGIHDLDPSEHKEKIVRAISQFASEFARAMADSRHEQPHHISFKRHKPGAPSTTIDLSCQEELNERLYTGLHPYGRLSQNTWQERVTLNDSWGKIDRTGLH